MYNNNKNGYVIERMNNKYKSVVYGTLGQERSVRTKYHKHAINPCITNRYVYTLNLSLTYSL